MSVLFGLPRSSDLHWFVFPRVHGCVEADKLWPSVAGSCDSCSPGLSTYRKCTKWLQAKNCETTNNCTLQRGKLGTINHNREDYEALNASDNYWITCVTVSHKQSISHACYQAPSGSVCHKPNSLSTWPSALSKMSWQPNRLATCQSRSTDQVIELKSKTANARISFLDLPPPFSSAFLTIPYLIRPAIWCDGLDLTSRLFCKEQCHSAQKKLVAGIAHYFDNSRSCRPKGSDIWFYAMFRSLVNGTS